MPGAESEAARGNRQRTDEARGQGQIFQGPFGGMVRLAVKVDQAGRFAGPQSDLKAIQSDGESPAQRLYVSFLAGPAVKKRLRSGGGGNGQEIGAFRRAEVAAGDALRFRHRAEAFYVHAQFQVPAEGADGQVFGVREVEAQRAVRDGGFSLGTIDKPDGAGFQAEVGAEDGAEQAARQHEPPAVNLETIADGALFFVVGEGGFEQIQSARGASQARAPEMNLTSLESDRNTALLAFDSAARQVISVVIFTRRFDG